MVLDLSVYSDLKSVSLAIINLCEISKSLHSRKLVQAKILWTNFSEVSLQYNVLLFLGNSYVKNILQFFHYELKTSCKTGEAGNNPFQ